MVFLRLLLLLVVGCLPTIVTVVSGGKTTAPAPPPNTCTDPPEPGHSDSIVQENCFDKTILLSESKHLIFDYDVSAEDFKHLRILCREEYVICYSTRQKMALFAVERLNGDAPKNKKTSSKRPKYLQQDSELFASDLSVLERDCWQHAYGFTKGHLVPQGDMTCDRSSLQTFKKSNIYPQYKIHNNHVWNSWEEYTRKKAKAKNNLLVITGITKGDKLVKGTSVSIPKEWYKVLVWCENKELQAEYIISLHEDKFKPKTNWGSIEKGLKETFTHKVDGETHVVDYEAKHCESVEEVEKVMKQTTKINFKISSSLTCDENNGQLVKKLSSSTDESTPDERGVYRYRYIVLLTYSSSTDESTPHERGVNRYCYPDVTKISGNRNRNIAPGSNCKDRQCVV